jgi:hypothetical protein
MGVSDVSIDLCSTDICVAEHALHASDVGSIHEEVCGETVAHRMGTDVFCNAGKLGV